MKRPFQKVLIVGAGPSGLLLALLLAKHGITVEIFEASDELDRQPRAAIFGSAAIPELRRAGLIDEIRRRGMSPTSIAWRRLENYSLIASIDSSSMADGLYRVTYGESSGLTLKDMAERQPQVYERMLPGHPKPGEYKLVSMSPYKMHQRCAPSFRVGRILLAADAAHLCNPWGGLGITGGFVDVGGLYDCLSGIWDGKADESILDLYSEKRIEKWKTITTPDPGLQALRAAENDPEAQKKMALASLEMRHDFTQHYKYFKE